jgi:hypothetical protein
MSIPKWLRNAFAAIPLLGVLAVAASAGDREHRHPDVDIESLRGELRRTAGEWLLEVRYDVEVEDYLPPPGTLELILYVTEHGYALVDQTGQPIEFLVPLECPSEVDDDELEFEDRVIVTLPDGVFHDPEHLRLEGIVVRIDDGRPLDRKDKSIKFDSPKPSRRYNLSIGGGISATAIWGGHYHVGTHVRHAVHRRVGVTRHRVSADRRRITMRPSRIAVGRRSPRVDRDRVGRHRLFGRTHRRARQDTRGWRR